ncbi:hypothetical protein QYM36_002309 [Artemia franciscana]|nr:hypothetical protein QYM36_002309 [Artemia franciscana]
MLWDTAGQEEFDAITKAYYRGAHAAVVTFSATDRHSFDAIRSWKKKVEEECGEIPMVIVQNKIDLVDQAVVEANEVEAMARNLHCRLYRTSVKEDLNVNQVFEYLAEKYLTHLDAMMAEENDLPPKSIMINDLTSAKSNKKKSQNSYSSCKTRTLGKIIRDTIKIQPTKKISKNVKNATCNLL